jgi:hypothetical protein
MAGTPCGARLFRRVGVAVAVHFTPRSCCSDRSDRGRGFTTRPRVRPACVSAGLQESLSIVSSFDMPRYAYDTARKTYHW